jgi:hypothetical protein
LAHEAPEKIDVPDTVWVSKDGCVAVNNNIARANRKSLLLMLPSALVTRSVLE